MLRCLGFYYLGRRRLCFYFGLFVRLSVWPSDNWKSCERIFATFVAGVGTNEFNFGDDPDHCPDPGVRSPKSGFTGLLNYQRILMKFYGELGCGLETNWLHFADDHHYPDPGVRSGSRSGSRKNCHNSIMLAFGGGLCSLSTVLVVIIVFIWANLFNLFAPVGNGDVKRSNEFAVLCGVHAVLCCPYWADLSTQRRHLEHVLHAQVGTYRPYHTHRYAPHS